MNRLVKFGRNWIDAISRWFSHSDKCDLQPNVRELKDAIKSSSMRQKSTNMKYEKIKLQRWINIRISHYSSILQMLIGTLNYQYCCIIFDSWIQLKNRWKWFVTRTLKNSLEILSIIIGDFLASTFVLMCKLYSLIYILKWTIWVELSSVKSFFKS